MNRPSNRRVVLKSEPTGVPGPEHFELKDVEQPPPGDGELACETLYLSLDPYMRGKISGRHMTGKINVGEMMAGEAVSRVIESQAEGFSPGDLVAAHSGWQSHPVIPAAAATVVDPRIQPASLALGICGMPGLTAWAAMHRLVQASAGATLVVSAAAGPVGSMVGQIGIRQGCRAIGIAGSDEKCDWLINTAGFADCINYKTEDLREGLKRCCPEGIDIYFDGVGGDVLQAAMEQLALNAQVVLCGLMAQYNQSEPLPGPTPGLTIKARATVKGLVVYDHEDMRADMINKLTKAIAADEIHYREDVTEGLAAAPEAFARLMRGENFGKAIVKIA